MNYSIAYYAAWGVAAVGVVAGVVAGASQTPYHPSWDTNDVAATAGIVAGVCTGLAALLPQVTRSPAAREEHYLRALSGILPDDLEAKHAKDRQGDANG